MIDQRTRRGCHGWQAPYLPLLCTVSIKIASYGEDDPPSLRPERHGRPNHRSLQWRTPSCIEEVRRSVVYSTNVVSQLQYFLCMITRQTFRHGCAFTCSHPFTRNG